MLMEEFQEEGTECIQSVGDADVDIVAVALKETAKLDRPVAVVADDTNISCKEGHERNIFCV